LAQFPSDGAAPRARCPTQIPVGVAPVRRCSQRPTQLLGRPCPRFLDVVLPLRVGPTVGGGRFSERHGSGKMASGGHLMTRGIASGGRCRDCWKRFWVSFSLFYQWKTFLKGLLELLL
jgi:hypothetical protein